MRRGRKKWISLQLVSHREGLEKLRKRKREKEKIFVRGGKNEYDEEITRILNKLNYAWQNNKLVIFIFSKDGHRIRCQSRIETVRDQKPRIILKNGERLDIEKIRQVKLCD